MFAINIYNKSKSHKSELGHLKEAPFPLYHSCLLDRDYSGDEDLGYFILVSYADPADKMTNSFRNHGWREQPKPVA